MKFQFFVLSICFICATGCYEPGYGTPQQQTNQPGNQGKTISPNDRSWLFNSEEDVLFFNPNLLNNAPCATLLEWTGPNTSASPLGITGVLTTKGYAWRTWNPGLRTFYVAKTNDSCDNPMSNAIVINGVYTGYQIGVNELATMTPEARKWIWCDWSGCQAGTWPCGCDGKANFLGTSWIPQGNQ